MERKDKNKKRKKRTSRVENLQEIVKSIKNEADELIKDGDESKYIIRVPGWQRGTKWQESDRRDFIDSIKNDEPIGQIILFKKPKSGSTEYLIVDGLQRSTTMKMFMDNPSFFFNEKDVIIGEDKEESIKGENYIEKILKIINKNSNLKDEEVDDVISEFVNRVRKTGKEEDSNLSLMEFMKVPINFIEYLKKKFSFENVSSDEIKLIETMLNKIILGFRELVEDLKISKINIEEFTGTEQDAKKVFINVNTKGVDLDEAELNSASWTEKFVVSKDENITAIVDKQIKKMENFVESSGINFDSDIDIDDIRKTRKMDLSYIIYGFGKVLEEKFPDLFKKGKDLNKFPSFAPTLINHCLGNYSNMKPYINKTIVEDYKFSDEDLNNFLIKIIEVIKEVKPGLNGLNKFEYNTKSNSSLKDLTHTELQIISYISNAFLNKYGTGRKRGKDGLEIDISKENDLWKEKLKTWKKNSFKIFAIDIFKMKWSGTGDAKINSSMNNLDYYTSDISKETMRASMDQRFIDEEMMTYRNGAARFDKLFLNMLIKSVSMPETDRNRQGYDIEHFFPRKRIKDLVEDFKDLDLKIATNHVGNLGLLPEDINRAKGSSTFYEAEDKVKEKGLTIEKVENWYYLSNKVDLEKLSSKNYSELEDGHLELVKDYKDYIKNRYEKMKNIILDHFFDKEIDNDEDEGLSPASV